MKLLILDNSYYPINFETEEFISQLGIDNVKVFTPRKDLYKNESYFNIIEQYELDKFIQDQKNYDALYLSNFNINFKSKIPYFYNIYSSPSLDNFDSFEYKYSQMKGANAVFINDKKLNKYANWMDLNTYLINDPVNTKNIKFYRDRKFFTPKLNIGYIPSDEDIKNIENTFLSSKNNWVLHIPDWLKIDVNEKNIVRHKIPSTGDYYDYSPIYHNSHIFVGNKKWKEAMLSGCVILGNQNNEGMFDKVNYFKSISLVDAINYADKRREKLLRMSKLGSNYIKKYFDLKWIVQQKLQIIKNNI